MVIAAIFTEIRLIYVRLRLQYYLSKLRDMKQEQIYKKYGVRKSKKKLLFIFIVWSILKQIVATVRGVMMTFVPHILQFFYSDKFPSYLKMMRKKGCKEKHLLRLTLIYMFGFSYSILFFYVQIYLLNSHKFKVVALSAMILLCCCLLPLIYKALLAISLLIIPTSGAITVRAAVLAVILFELNIVAFANISYNFDSITESISCESKALSDITSLKDKRGERRFKTELQEGSPMKKLIDNIKSVIEFQKKIFKSYIQVIRLVLDLPKIMTEAFNKFINSILDGSLTENMSIFIKGPLWLLRKVGSLIVKFIKLIFERVKKVFKNVAKPLIAKLKKDLNETFYVKFKSNYVFRATSNQEVSLKQIFKNSKKSLAKKHSYIGTIFNALFKLAPLLFIWAFIRMFGFTFIYYIMFMNFRGYNNQHITKDFKRYNQEMMKEGKMNLFPFFQFEYDKYTDLYGTRITQFEHIKMVIKIVIDCIMAIYIIILFIVDFLIYKYAILVRVVTLAITDDILPEKPIDPKSNFLGLFSLNSEKFLNDFGAFRDKLRNCVPEPSPVSGDVYIKCLIMMTIQITLTLLAPYLNRTRICVMYKLYPELVRVRTVWLYNYITYMRLIEIMKIMMVNPATGMTDLVKVGSAFEGTISDDDEKSEEEEIEDGAPINIKLLKGKETKSKRKKPKRKLKELDKPSLPRTKDNKYAFMDAIAINLGIKASKPKCAACYKEVKLTPGNFLDCANMQCNSCYCMPCISRMGFRCCKCNEITIVADNAESIEEDSSLEGNDSLFPGMAR